METLQQYFRLQFTILKRQITDFGVNPLVGFIIGLIVFYSLSYQLFTKTGYASYIYIFIALSIVFAYSETNRNEFLQFTFPGKSFRKIRMVENVGTIIPFIIFLLLKGQWISLFILTVVSIVLSFVRVRQKYGLTIPTPFYKKPFEFIVGFRAFYGLFFVAYFLTVMSIIYQNFNLGIFSLLLSCLICLSFYNSPENEFFVWIHHLKPHQFLLDKIKTALLFSTMLCIPIVLTLLLMFSTYFVTIIGFLLLGYCYLLTMIFAKYSTYPHKMDIVQAIGIACSITMPPLLLFIAPYFYFQSIKKLKVFLG